METSMCSVWHEALPTEFDGKRWRFPDECTPVALVTYASEPSPETGHVGWCWWALGKMGEAAGYEAACAAAERVVNGGARG
jgi:hypothetical protein